VNNGHTRRKGKNKEVLKNAILGWNNEKRAHRLTRSDGGARNV
jgi:hypothetical protein